MKNSDVEKYLSNLYQNFSGIESIFLFGSYLHSDSPNDVDIVIVFSNQLYVYQSRIVKKNFLGEFGKFLDIQIFTSSQHDQILNFLNKCGQWIEIYDKGSSS